MDKEISNVNLKLKNISSKEINEHIINFIKDESIHDTQILDKINEYLNTKIDNLESILEEFRLKEEPKTNSNIVISNTPNLNMKPIDTQNNMNIIPEREDERKILTAFKIDDINGTKKIDKGSTWENYKEKGNKKDKVNNENQNTLNNKFIGKKRNKPIDNNEGKNKEKQNIIRLYTKLRETYKNNSIRNILKIIYNLNDVNQDDQSNKELKKLLEKENALNLLFIIINIHLFNIKQNQNNGYDEQFYTDSKSGIKISKSQVIISKKPSEKKEETEDDKIDSLKSVDSTMSRGSSRYRKELGLGIHLHKDINNKIYKYCLHHFLGETNAIFYCSDKECSSVATYNVDTKVFTITNEHSKTHEQHNYIMNFKNEKRDKLIMVEFEKKPFIDGQVFRRGEGKRIVQWYTIKENTK